MNKHSSFPWSVGNFALLCTFTFACSDSGVGMPGAPQQPGAGASPTATTQALPRSEIAFVAAPNATCKVHEAAVDPAMAATVYGDDQGVVRLYASPVRPNEAQKALSVECNEGTADHVAVALDLADPATFRSIEPSAAPINRTILSPLGAERDSIPIAKLLKDGYPPRPDAAQRPEAYARWASFVSRPISVVKPNVVESEIHGDPQSTANNKSWTGTKLTGAGPYLLSDVTFWIPQIPVSPVGSIIIWGGVGGSDLGSGSALIQNGINLRATGSVSTYTAFYEYWRNNGINVTNFSVRPGDLVESYAFPTDDNLNWNGVGTHGCFGFNNLTQGTSCSGLCMATNSRNPPFLGLSAEFILEPQLGAVPNINKVEVDGFAWAAGGRYADQSTDPYTLLQLINQAGTQTLVRAARINNQGVLLSWLSGTR